MATTPEQNYRTAVSAISSMSTVKRQIEQNSKVFAEQMKRLTEVWPILTIDQKSLISSNVTALGLDPSEVLPQNG